MKYLVLLSLTMSACVTEQESPGLDPPMSLFGDDGSIEISDLPSIPSGIEMMYWGGAVRSYCSIPAGLMSFWGVNQDASECTIEEGSDGGIRRIFCPRPLQATSEIVSVEVISSTCIQIVQDETALLVSWCPDSADECYQWDQDPVALLCNVEDCEQWRPAIRAVL